MRFLWFGKQKEEMEPATLEDLKKQMQSTKDEMNELIDTFNNLLLLRTIGNASSCIISSQELYEGLAEPSAQRLYLPSSCIP